MQPIDNEIIRLKQIGLYNIKSCIDDLKQITSLDSPEGLFISDAYDAFTEAIRCLDVINALTRLKNGGQA